MNWNRYPIATIFYAITGSIFFTLTAMDYPLGLWWLNALITIIWFTGAVILFLGWKDDWKQYKERQRTEILNKNK